MWVINGQAQGLTILVLSSPIPNSNNWFILDQFREEDGEQDSSDDNNGDDDNAEAGVLEMSREEYMAYFT